MFNKLLMAHASSRSFPARIHRTYLSHNLHHLPTSPFYSSQCLKQRSHTPISRPNRNVYRLRSLLHQEEIKDLLVMRRIDGGAPYMYRVILLHMSCSFQQHTASTISIPRLNGRGPVFGGGEFSMRHGPAHCWRHRSQFPCSRQAIGI